MKNVTKMTGTQLVSWMDKEIKTIQTSHKGDTGSKRFGIRAARFDELKSELVDLGAWEEYCNSRGMETDLEATDCAA